MEISDFYNFDSTLRVAEEYLKGGPAVWGGLEWQTDPALINLEVLASAPLISPEILRVPGTKMHIENIPLKDIHIGSRPYEIDGPELQRYLPLYSLVKAGTKIIPATVVRRYCVANGEAVEHGMSYPIHVTDGAHRLELAKWLYFETVPILFVDVIGRYTFDRDMFTAEPDNEGGLKFTNKDTGNVYTLDLSRVFPLVDSSLKWTFDVHM